MTRSNGSWWGGILVALGVLLLLDNLDVVSIGQAIRDYWPGLLILGGVWLIFRDGAWTRPTPPVTGSKTGDNQIFGDIIANESTDFLAFSTVFGDTRISADSKQLHGGSVYSVFGDCTVDCSAASFAAGEQSIRISGVFGDISVILPQGTVYALGAHTMFGGIHAGNIHRDGISSSVSYRPPEFDTAQKRVRLELSGVFGDIEVHG